VSTIPPVGGNDNQEWRLLAACRNIDPELFFPPRRTGAGLDHIEAAKSVCRRCAVQLECLEFALAANQQDGVWGGTSEDERRHLRPAWLAQRPPTATTRRDLVTNGAEVDD
jgi:WhiB family transcriptional regulator, redox-sensing transcriptional regulator